MHAENPENFAAQTRKSSREVFRKSHGIFSGFPGRAARADPSVRRHRRLAERALHAPVPTGESHLGGPAATCTHKREQYTQNGARSTFVSFDRLAKRFAGAAAWPFRANAEGKRRLSLLDLDRDTLDTRCVYSE
jgi:hypothetical protein